MSILEKLSEDLKVAMKKTDKLRVSTIRLLIAQMKNERINLQKDLTPEQEMAVLMNAAKKRKEAIAIYQTSSRNDLLEKEKLELEIINEYLPAQLTEAEIEKEIIEVIERTAANSIKDVGKVMAEAMKSLKGKADGKLVQQIVRSKLA